MSTSRLLPALVAVSLAGPVFAATLYVDANLTTGANNGTSWADAFQGRLGVKAAMAAAAICERRMSPG